MAAWGKEAEAVMAERFGTDTVIPLATVEDGIPYVRSVNALYVDGAFYFVTDARSNKVRHIQKEPTVAIAGEWMSIQTQSYTLTVPAMNGPRAPFFPVLLSDGRYQQ